MDQISATTAIKKACNYVGGQSEMAKRLGISPPTVNQWINGPRKIPARRCPEIEKVTSGVVRCEELRPDVDWSYLRGTQQ